LGFFSIDKNKEEEFFGPGLLQSSVIEMPLKHGRRPLSASHVAEMVT
jgi:hypothetical protein